MIKVIDIDKLFDKYISDYVYGNIGKVKPEEIENEIPRLYEKFGDEKLAELNGKTPNTFYDGFSCKELLDCLKKHLSDAVPVSDFLCEAICSAPDAETALGKELENDNSEEYNLYLINMLYTSLESKKHFNRLLEFVSCDYTETIKEVSAEVLSENADAVKESVLSQFADADEKTKEYFTEILSNASKDDKVFDLLVLQFVKHPNNIPLYASYLGKYGDERAIPFLTEAIENEKISYADFEELRFNIEKLGGEYNKKRDFSSDKTFRKIKGFHDNAKDYKS